MINWAALLELLYNISQASKAQETKNRKKGKRKRFSKKTRGLKLKLENHRCEACGKYSEHLDFHHKNGDRTNNHITNCQLLCPDCHAKKTRSSKMNFRV